MLDKMVELMTNAGYSRPFMIEEASGMTAKDGHSI